MISLRVTISDVLLMQSLIDNVSDISFYVDRNIEKLLIIATRYIN